MYVCACVHAWDIPHIPWQTATPTPPRGDPWNESKVNKNWTNWDISILFEDFQSLHPCAHIQIILGVQVGGVLSQIAFFIFEPKNVHILCSCEPPGKNFPVFTLESDRPSLDWQLIWFLTTWLIYDPFKSQLKWRQKCKIWLWRQFYHRTINHRNICNVPLDAAMCRLQIINDIEPLSSTLHGLNACFIHQPPSKKWQFWLQHQFFQRAVNCKKIWNVLLDSLMCALQSNVCPTNHQWHWTTDIDPSWGKRMLYQPPIKIKNHSISHKLETAQPKK